MSLPWYLWTGCDLVLHLFRVTYLFLYLETFYWREYPFSFTTKKSLKNFCFKLYIHVLLNWYQLLMTWGNVVVMLFIVAYHVQKFHHFTGQMIRIHIVRQRWRYFYYYFLLCLGDMLNIFLLLFRIKLLRNIGMIKDNLLLYQIVLG